ncbi:hypothetical protein PAHA111176_08090 [Parendozoicomonas haliclonae]|uniref:Uncharacterized protein n=1 Tax=Parendozoicomonas haliclonae TaxID=1960125 RepID=A0A1X7AE77_9GAMM|nr:hypothetical protein EHSB41UT_00313 [Parendozoicomonas haliclonae]
MSAHYKTTEADAPYFDVDTIIHINTNRYGEYGRLCALLDRGKWEIVRFSAIEGATLIVTNPDGSNERRVHGAEHDGLFLVEAIQPPGARCTA